MCNIPIIPLPGAPAPTNPVVRAFDLTREKFRSLLSHYVHTTEYRFPLPGKKATSGKTNVARNIPHTHAGLETKLKFTRLSINTFFECHIEPYLVIMSKVNTRSNTETNPGMAPAIRLLSYACERNRRRRRAHCLVWERKSTMLVCLDNLAGGLELDVRTTRYLKMNLQWSR